MRISIVKAARDEDAGVWIVESSDVDGLRVEGDTFEAFCRNVSYAVSDLLGDEGDDAPIEIIAHAKRSIQRRVGLGCTGQARA